MFRKKFRRDTAPGPLSPKMVPKVEKMPRPKICAVYRVVSCAGREAAGREETTAVLYRCASSGDAYRPHTNGCPLAWTSTFFSPPPAPPPSPDALDPQASLAPRMSALVDV